MLFSPAHSPPCELRKTQSIAPSFAPICVCVCVLVCVFMTLIWLLLFQQPHCQTSPLSHSAAQAAHQAQRHATYSPTLASRPCSPTSFSYFPFLHCIFQGAILRVNNIKSIFFSKLCRLCCCCCCWAAADLVILFLSIFALLCIDSKSSTTLCHIHKLT